MPAGPEPVTVARHAMATRFEIVLHGPNPVALRAAGEEALAEIDRVESLLSLYRNTSEIAHVNARAALEPVRVSSPVFRLLEQALGLSAATGGAFDATIAPLVRCWGFMGGTGQMPEPGAVAKARANVGYSLVELDPSAGTVRFARPGVMLDLGAIGKGYAIEQAAEILREAGVASAMIHGGTSTVYAIGAPPDAPAWQIALERPVVPSQAESVTSPPLPPTVVGAGDPAAASRALLAVVPLRDVAMSVSAIWGRSFRDETKLYGHVIDPRTGQPVAHSLLAVVVLPSATETDALSTALLTQGAAWLPNLVKLRPAVRALLAGAPSTNEPPPIAAVGISWT